MRMSPFGALGAVMLGGALALAPSAASAAPLTFEDQRLSACVDRAVGHPATTDDISAIKKLNCAGMGIVTLTGVEQLTALTDADFTGNHIADTSPLTPLGDGPQEREIDIRSQTFALPVAVVGTPVNLPVVIIAPRINFPFEAAAGVPVTINAAQKSWTFTAPHSAGGDATISVPDSAAHNIGNLTEVYSATITQSAVWAAPAVATEPASTQVVLKDPTASRDVTFTAAPRQGPGLDPAPVAQWQVKLPGNRWRNVARGATGDFVVPANGSTLTVPDATVDDDGLQVRVVYTDSTGGAVTSKVATLAVHAGPMVTGPKNVTVREGGTAVLEAEIVSVGERPTGTWECSTDSGASWEPVAEAVSDEDDADDAAADGDVWLASLELSELTADADGVQCRIVVKNSWGEVTSRGAKISVTPGAAPTTPRTNPATPGPRVTAIVTPSPRTTGTATVSPSGSATTNTATAAPQGRLSNTGVDATPLIAAAAGLVAVGVLALLMVRRRRA